MQTSTGQSSDNRLINAVSIDEAIAHLQTAPAIAIAGATWVMRAKARGEQLNANFINLSRIEALHDLKADGDYLAVGAMVTHEKLVNTLDGAADLACLAEAAGKAANPAIRRMATIGGNICSFYFAASDIVPALLCLNAIVEMRDGTETERITFDDFLNMRAAISGPRLVTRILIPRSENISAHARLLMRKAGEYPVANLSASIGFDDDGKVAIAHIAVGAVEQQAKRWTALEEAICGNSLKQSEIKALAEAHLDSFNARDGADAPGWYRKRILPKLACQVFGEIGQIRKYKSGG